MGVVDNTRQAGGGQHNKRETADIARQVGDGLHNKSKGVDYAGKGRGADNTGG